jgi:hypothetical protein
MELDSPAGENIAPKIEIIASTAAQLSQLQFAQTSLSPRQTQ